MHSKNDDIEIMIIDKAINGYQNDLETSMRGSDFFFDCVHSLYYKCHKINLNPCGSYIDSPTWIKDKKATINPINKKNNKCFQYAVTVALNHEEVRKDPRGITKIKPFIDKYNWEGINYPSEKDNWKKFEKNNRLLLMFCMLKKEKILLMFQNILQILKTGY